MAGSPRLELVAKRTFLTIEIAPLMLTRNQSDSIVRYGFGSDQDDTSSCGGSRGGGGRCTAWEVDEDCDSTLASDEARSVGKEDGQSSACAEAQTPEHASASPWAWTSSPGSAAAPEPESPRCWPDSPRSPCGRWEAADPALLKGSTEAWQQPACAWAAMAPGYAQELPQGWPEPPCYVLLPAPFYFYGGIAADAGAPWCQVSSPTQAPAVAEAAAGTAAKANSWVEEAAEPEPEQHEDEASSGDSGSRDRLSDKDAAKLRATTVYIQNLPNDYTHAMLEGLVNSLGFIAAYDFMYVPVDFKRKCGLGYGFVNLETHEAALDLKKKLEGFKDWEVSGSSKVCHVGWAIKKCQGKKANIEYYRNNSVMHDEVDERWQPAIYERGVRVAFPKPTKKVRKPRPKHASDPRWRMNLASA